jgi:transcriptional activator HAC1
LLVFVDNKEKQRIQSSSKTSPPTVEMDSWAAHTPTPNLKFENSPAESLLSTPEEMFPSLFGSEASSNMPTLNPIDMMSPQSLRDITPDVSVLAGLQSTPGTPSEASPAPEKKPVKKRKSWGQVLPEPKTNLPPRKRAKTEDEKEQRRVERVLRNRRAAQSSRERKRQEVEGLEQRNKELQEQLRQSQAANIALMNELRKFQRTPGVMARAPATFDTLRPSPLTLSQELFSSQDSHGLSTDNATLEQLLSSLPTNNTVNPASLSPTLTPVPEADEENEPATTVASFDSTTIVNTSPDATQHPAEMLCQGLQCRSAEVPQWLASQQAQPALALLQFLLMSTSTMVSLCQRPLTQIAMSLKAGFSLPPTPAILNTIILLVTNPSPSRRRSSTSTTLSQTTTFQLPSSSRSTAPTAARPPTRRSSSLRLKFLRKILTCSPTLARPLMDATMEALRLVSTEGFTVDRVSEGDVRTAAATNGKAQQPQQGMGRTSWLNGAQLPSKEVLITLLWVLRTEERRLEIRQQLGSSSKPGRLSAPLKSMAPTTNGVFVLTVKRSLGGEGSLDASLKRRRVE